MHTSSISDGKKNNANKNELCSLFTIHLEALITEILSALNENIS